MTDTSRKQASGPEVYSKTLFVHFGGIFLGFAGQTLIYLVLWSPEIKASSIPCLPCPAHPSRSVQWINIIEPLPILNLTEAIPLPPEFPFLEAFHF